ncbi:MAG: hypothetical protein OXI43_12475 [Candidatus Poribacteria bacterium]|nr:hypothetical protein [Candidatus Poribacteria bacterium]
MQGNDPLRHVCIRLYVDDYIANSTKRTCLRYHRLRETAHATHTGDYASMLMRFCFARLACIETPSKKEIQMFRVPTALENLRNKEQQYQAAVKALHEANTYPDIIKCFQLERKQYYQYREVKYRYEAEVREGSQ